MSEFDKNAEIDSDDDEPEVKEEEKEPEVQEDTTVANSDVTTKYQEAARIVNGAMAHIQTLCVPGTALLDICKAGDAFIEQGVAGIFRGKGKDGKPLQKGVAFPVCISVNEYVCHYSPLNSEDKVDIYVCGSMFR
jgi:methionine aminopeptidase